MKINRLKLIIWLFVVLPAAAMSDDLNDQRTVFLQAEKYLKEKKEALFLEASSGITDYPLYPYLRYLWVKEHLNDTGQVLSFLDTYKTTRYSGLLRSKWLDYLAEQARWQDFVRYYEENEHSADDCRWQWARYQTGQQPSALSAAKGLWVLGEAVGKNCQPLFSALQKSLSISQEQIWQRFVTAIENNRYDVAKDTSLLLKQPERKQAEIWLRLYQKPELVIENRFWQDKNPLNGRLFAYTIKRLANSDLDKAITIWDVKKTDFPMDKPDIDAVERKLGLALLGKKDNRAYSRLSKISQPDEETRGAEVRAALLEQNWQHVNSAVADLTSDERKEPKWQYWQARALQETGSKQQADTLFSVLAKDRSYYGFLAADRVNTPYQINDSPVKATHSALEELSGQPDFKASWEFKWLGNDMEARRQWQFAIKDLPKEKLLIAAKLAQQWHWDQQAITTLVKADYWDDMSMRFPLGYLNEVQASAELHNLEPAMLYGLMRQESMLDTTAESSVGAKGLMQLMPETGMTIAKTLHEPWQSPTDLFKPDLNLRYGGYYFKDMLNRFNNHVAVAGAAYNAGPNRAKRWLPSAAAVPADIWIETIPFKETRKYVATVLSYVVIYQERLKKGKLKLMDLMRDILPG